MVFREYLSGSENDGDGEANEISNVIGNADDEANEIGCDSCVCDDGAKGFDVFFEVTDYEKGNCESELFV
jgi:hypothetical protein